MITEVILPKLGQTMEEGTIVEWLKQEGDRVQRGDVLFTVESDKAVLEVEATQRGFLRQILVPAGETVAVLTVVAIMTRMAMSYKALPQGWFHPFDSASQTRGWSGHSVCERSSHRLSRDLLRARLFS